MCVEEDQEKKHSVQRQVVAHRVLLHVVPISNLEGALWRIHCRINDLWTERGG